MAYNESSIFRYWYSKQILNQALKDEIIEVPSKVGVDWNHAIDIAQGFMKASINERAYGQVFQLASNAYLTWKEFADRIVRWTHSTSGIVEIPIEEWNLWHKASQDPSQSLLCSFRKAERLLTYNPEYLKERFLRLLKEQIKNTANRL